MNGELVIDTTSMRTLADLLQRIDKAGFERSERAVNVKCAEVKTEEAEWWHATFAIGSKRVAQLQKELAEVKGEQKEEK